jgi:hypothetical protein
VRDRAELRRDGRNNPEGIAADVGRPLAGATKKRR